VADTPTRELLAEYRARHDRIALVVLLEGEDAEAPLQALGAGASAALDRSASRNEIIAAVKAVATGLVVVPPDLLATLLPEAPPADDVPASTIGAAEAIRSRPDGYTLFLLPISLAVTAPGRFSTMNG
jgi:DNA-binding NarL/FixJ family response regulator